MFTQKTQSSAPMASKTGLRRSRKFVAIIASAALVVILAAIGVYFAAFRSLPTTVSWAPSVSIVLPGDDLTVSGQITPAVPGRDLLLQSASSSNGPWQRMPQAATTDSHGRFAITFKPQISGPILIRVVVDSAGRYLGVGSQAKPVQILSLSSVSLKGAAMMDTQTSLTFTATVNPISAGRTVTVEQSSDKLRWAPVGLSVQTKAGGTSVLKAPAPGVGVWHYRAKVGQDDTYVAAVSAPVGVKVVDLKAEAAKAAAAKAAAATAAANAASAAEAAQKAVGTRPAPQYGYQCRPGDENLYDVCASHKTWIDDQNISAACRAAGKTWDIATQTCP